MKKIYFSTLFVLAAASVSAQIQNPVSAKRTKEDVTKPVAHNNAVTEKITIWGSTFDTPSEWVIDHDAADCSLDWAIGNISCQGSYPINDINSTTAADGWAVLDSDFYGGASGGSEVEDSWLTMATPVDLTSYPNVVVQFETYYRRYNYERPYLVVGFGDGSGPGSVVWPNLNPDTDISGMTNVFDIFPGFANSSATNNPQLAQVNISSALAAAGNVSEVYIRLNWTGTWGYAWFVDDFKIVEQPLEDIQLWTAWFSGENNEGIEYGRTPDHQLDANYFCGGQIYNFGVNDQTAVDLDVNYVAVGAGTGFTSAGASGALAAGDTVVIEQTENQSLMAGTVYTGTYTATSSGEMGGSEFYNNEYMRAWEVTSTVYGADGLGNHPAGYETIGSLGPMSFFTTEDGMWQMNYFHIKQDAAFKTVRVLISTNSVAGAEVYAHVVDTAAWFAADLSSTYADSDPYTITATDVSNGYFDITFADYVVLNPDAWMVGVEIYTYDSYDTRVLDDKTVAQPYYASMIYTPSDNSVYSNGEAWAIRIQDLTTDVSVEENTLTGVSVYPNPSAGVITISNENNDANTITVYDMVGNVVATKSATSSTTIDLTAAGTGVYLVKVANDNGSLVERVVIK